MPRFDKVVVVTRRTRLEGLVERFNTRAQARFYLEHAGLDFSDYQAEHDTYHRALDSTLGQVDRGLKVQVLDRALVPTYLFGPSDVVLVLGQDGTVANAAKYVGTQPVVGVNPDPFRFDGVLLPFQVPAVRAALAATLEERASFREVTLAEARLNDGQRLLAFNDLFIGARTHVSAHYRVRAPATTGWERQSSSGLIVSTGAGSTGWLSSVMMGARRVTEAVGGSPGTAPVLRWEDPRLFFVVREPFESRHSRASVGAGFIGGDAPLVLESLMPSNGVIFGDGVEDDALHFTSGLTATIGPAGQRARLVTAVERPQPRG